MLIRTVDALDYLSYRKNDYESKIQKSKEEYLKVKEKYENRWWAKILRLKYDDLWDFWDWKMIPYWLDKVITLRNKIEYAYKLELDTINSRELDEFENGFYNWCKENNRPY